MARQTRYKQQQRKLTHLKQLVWKQAWIAIRQAEQMEQSANIAVQRVRETAMEAIQAIQTQMETAEPDTKDYLAKVLLRKIRQGDRAVKREIRRWEYGIQQTSQIATHAVAWARARTIVQFALT
jgi:hypothetical protein